LLEPSRIPEHSALLVVDVQRGSIDEDSPALAAIRQLIAEHRDRFACIIASRYVNVEGSPCRVLLGSDSMSRRDETALHEGIALPGVVVIDKSTYALGDLLEPHLEGIENLVLCGVDTHACVLHEALDAFDRCIRPIVLAELCESGNGEDAHGCALDVLRHAVGVHNVWEGAGEPH
jgi:nicotinamidase-related amidase